MSGKNIDIKDKKKKHFNMLRTMVLADFITLANAACGVSSIFSCLNFLANGKTVEHYLSIVFVLLPLSLLLDMMDGYVARKLKSQSKIGADLDSLSDIVSFGVAPSVLGFTLGMRGGWDMAILVYFVSCGISRLARYNVTASEMADETGKVKYYEGAPIPTSLIIVAILLIAYLSGNIYDNIWFGEYRLLGYGFHPLSVLYFIAGSLMISETVHIPKF
eukprot:TRINITY_DN1295_c0_g1_i1.p1 TRINITY_DN1295_c0_g1~~TRINITY_DN1295_c0_g1_i1.p1  ORF type:complete len:218 (-),score=61.82 TRINITY_DN1295_c0_g1_i1:198-851(-)